MSELFIYGVDTLEKEAKSKIWDKKSNHNLLINYLQLDFLFNIIWFPFQVCQQYK